MVPLPSVKVSRVSTYSGYHYAILHFVYEALTLSGWLSQNHSTMFDESRPWSEPRIARNPVWALPLSLAATYGITFVFSSSGYLDVSVHRVPSCTLCIYVQVLEVCSSGSPHSEIDGSFRICRSPSLIAAYHVFLRLLVPRHPPCALVCVIMFSIRKHYFAVDTLFTYFLISSACKFLYSS